MRKNEINYRCLIIQSSKAIEQGVEYLQNNAVLDPIMWIVHNKITLKSISVKFPETLFLNAYEMCRMNFSEPLNYSGIYINKNSLTELHANFPILIEMMNRFEGEYPITHVDRVTYIYAQFYHWAKILEEIDVNMVLQFDVPHDVYDYIIYIIASANGVKTIHMQHSRFYSSLNIGADIIDKSINTIRLINVMTATSNLLSRVSVINETTENSVFSDKFNNNLLNLYTLNENSALDETDRQQQNLLKNKVQDFSQLKDDIFNFFGKILLLIKNDTFADNYIMNMPEPIHEYPTMIKFLMTRKSIHKQTQGLVNHYSSKTIQLSSINKKFLYFALHYQPERSTCPDGGYYSNPYFILQEVLTYLSNDVVIIIKEHPRQFSKKVRNQSYRTKFIYDQMIGLRNVFFISECIKTKDILKNVLLEGVLTVRGSIILEASLNKVPTFIFGKTVFNKLPYVFDCNNRQNLININKLLKSSCRSKIDTTCIGENLSDISKKSFMSHNDINNEFGNIDQERFNHYLLDCFKNS